MHSPSVADTEETPMSAMRQVLQLLPQSLPTQPSQIQGTAEGLRLPVSTHTHCGFPPKSSEFNDKILLLVHALQNGKFSDLTALWFG